MQNPGGSYAYMGSSLSALRSQHTPIFRRGHSSASHPMGGEDQQGFFTFSPHWPVLSLTM